MRFITIKWLFAAAMAALISVGCDNPVNIIPCESCIIDRRDGRTYRTTQIGNLEWMAENLNYKTKSSLCYDNKSGNCTKYGRLYTWGDAMGNKKLDTTWSTIRDFSGICPAEWRIPNQDDFEHFMEAIGDSAAAGSKLKASSGWNFEGDGTDDFGFAGLPGGGRHTKGKFWGIGNNGFWWIAHHNRVHARIFGLGHGNENIGVDWDYKTYAFSVRCVKNITD